MRKQKFLAKEFEFYFSDLDNLILVECLDDGTVRIHQTRDNISEKRKVFFIRGLAAEGFIPDEYQWFSGTTDSSTNVQWLKDLSWLKTHYPSRSQTNRTMGALLVAGCILWMAMMRILLVSNNNTADEFLVGNSIIVSPATPSRAGLTQVASGSLAPRYPLTQLDK